jgi:hypothetical protein
MMGSTMLFPWYSALLRLTLCLMVVLDECRADCGIEQPTLSEQLETALTVARFTNANRLIQPPCGLEPFNEEADEDNGSQEGISLYTVEDIFQDSDTTMMVGDTIPIAWSTDTGYRHTLPDRFDATEGFLGVLEMVGSCYINDTYVYPYPEDKEPLSFSMNECTNWNKPWSEISKSDRVEMEVGDVECLY